MYCKTTRLGQLELRLYYNELYNSYKRLLTNLNRELAGTLLQ